MLAAMNFTLSAAYGIKRAVWRQWENISWVADGWSAVSL